MSKNKWVRSISFNHTNEKDVKRLKLIGGKSFSRYIKKLLDEEIQRQSTVVINRSPSGTPQKRNEVLPKESAKPMVNPMLQKKVK